MSTAVYEIMHAQSDEEIMKCFDILKVLRPHLEKEEFVNLVRTLEKEGYKLIFIADAKGVKSAAGYRITSHLAWGKVLYIDDLITLPEARGTGFGTHLIKWLMGEAKKNSCDGIHLDTGIRHEEAHRLYLNLGMKIDGLHLSMHFD
ncbi:MAG: hypothetical protein KR126chlam1_01221 [Chlamydiae bacterium]|nr:hypothetical protein [Chlamydiota bacterium]